VGRGLELAVGDQERELRARAHPEPAVDQPQVELDRLGAEQQLGGDLAVRRAARDGLRDPALLPGQLVAVGRPAAAAARGAQLGLRALRPGAGTVFGQNGSDTINGGRGDDKLNGNAGSDTISGGEDAGPGPSTTS
jgi:hypothetical protein